MQLRTRPRVLLDADEVLADFQGSVLGIISRVTGKPVCPSDCKQWDFFSQFLQTPEHHAEAMSEVGLPGFCASIAPLPGAQEGVARLREVADVYVVTSPFDSTPWVQERYAWLWEHFQIPRKHVVFTSSKFLVDGDMLVDDRPENVINWKIAYPDRQALLWDIPNTRGQHPELDRVSSWDQVLDRLQTIIQTRRGL